ncbi:MAG: DNA polymerase, partial [Chloroflexota bacterium]
VAQREYNGVPIDVGGFDILTENMDSIQDSLIKSVDVDYGVYDGRTFKIDRFADYLSREGISWPRLASGQLDLQDDTFKTMSNIHPALLPLRELRATLAQTRLRSLAVGSDGRNRCLLSPFSSKTGRNQPSNTRFIFGPAVWLRSLIKPSSGHGIAYIDWSQQEFGIAAALSGDPLMIAAYESGDPYLAFAKQAGAVPADGTKGSHPVERNRFKACVLAVQYGMGADSLAIRINQSPAHAAELLRLHRDTYKIFWKWSDCALDYSLLHGKLWTVFGWTLHIGADPNPRSIRNFPMQANGAEMLRLACCFCVERGIKVCAPVHDAILIEAPLEELENAIAAARQAMSDASAIVLNGFRLRTDVAVFRYPDCYVDERGEKMWNIVMKITNEIGVVP